MAIDCRNPFDERPMWIEANIPLEATYDWCDGDVLVQALSAACRALGKAWWDVWLATPGIKQNPWVVEQVKRSGDGLLTVDTHGMEIVSIVDDKAQLAPKGYPPAITYWKEELELMAIRENMQMVFGRPALLTDDDMKFIAKVFKDTYFGVLGRTRSLPNRIRCASRGCDTGWHTDIAWYGSGWVNICQAFYGVSPRLQATSIAQEWIHQFGEVGHEGTPPIQEADYYSIFVARYL